MRHSSVVAVLGAALLAGCNDSTSPDGNAVSLSFAARSSSALTSAAPGLNADIVIGSGASAVTITRVQFVLREIELKKTETGACVEASNDDECEEISLGPVLVDLPLDGTVGAPLSVDIPEGSYREVEFELHKPEDDGDARDRAFVAANPAFENISVRVEGTQNGQPFVFTSAVNAELELEFEPALVVGPGGTNATVNVDVASWFRSSSGATLAPTPANLNAIAANIAASFRAFEDHDRDGRRDD